MVFPLGCGGGFVFALGSGGGLSFLGLWRRVDLSFFSGGGWPLLNSGGPLQHQNKCGTKDYHRPISTEALPPTKLKK